MAESVSRETFNFDGLTAPQRLVLTQRGWTPGNGHKQPNPRTLRPLVERQLLVPRVMSIGLAKITAYDMPQAVCEAFERQQKQKIGALN
jgi:hypothetical protein